MVIDTNLYKYIYRGLDNSLIRYSSNQSLRLQRPLFALPLYIFVHDQAVNSEPESLKRKKRLKFFVGTENNKKTWYGYETGCSATKLKR